MKKKILIIDDDHAVRESLRRLLEETGYTVLDTANGEDGAARLEKCGWDLLLLDLELPNLSGWDVLDLAHSRRPALPVIILTGLLDQCEPGALGGADALLVKPPDVNLLLQTVQQLLNESPEERNRRLAAALAGGRGRPVIAPGYLSGPTWTCSWPKNNNSA